VRWADPTNGETNGEKNGEGTPSDWGRRRPPAGSRTRFWYVFSLKEHIDGNELFGVNS